MSAHAHDPGLVHAAAFYEGDDGFQSRMLPFVRAGLEAGEPVLVMVPRRKLDALRDALGDDAREVEFADITVVGANPGLLINAWRDFVRRRSRPGRAVRGIGEPIWPGREPAELADCRRQEELVNLAFAGGPPVQLVCPYDEVALDQPVLEGARRSHPLVLADGRFAPCPDYAGLEALRRPFDEPLPDPPPGAAELAFDHATLDQLRAFVMRRAAQARLGERRAEEVALAVNELAGNSVRHGGGAGVLLSWEADGAFVAEVRDRGHISDPLVGLEPAATGELGGHGLWLVNNLCNLMQIRSSRGGTAIRVRFRSSRPASHDT